MELWIRTQDKECLMKVNRVDYDLSNSEHRIMANGYETLVGHYETKKRALEILDEIQTELATLNYQYLHRGQHFITTASNVYEMPEE